MTALGTLGCWANGACVRLSLRGKARLLPRAASSVRSAILRRRDRLLVSRASAGASREPSSRRSPTLAPHTCAVSPTLPYVAFLFVAFALAVLSAARLACPRQIRRGGSVDLLIRKRRQVVYAPSQHRIARWLRRRGSFAAPPQMLRRKTRLTEGEARDEGASAELSDMQRRGSSDAR